MKVRFVLLLGLFTAGCRATLNDDPPIRIVGSFSLDDGKGNACNLANNVQQSSGSLDLDLSSTYVLRFNIDSTLEPVALKYPDRPLQGPEQNDFLVNAVAVNYILGGTPSNNAPYVMGGTQIGNTQRIPLSGLIRAGTVANAWALSLLTASAASSVRASLGVGAQNQNTLFLSFVLEGRLTSGQSIKSTNVTFPVVVFRGGVSPADLPTALGCAAGVPVSRTGPCRTFPGQDGAILACCRGPLQDNPSVKAGCS